MGAEGHGRCSECGSVLAQGQRYCLLCGARVGSPDPLLAQLQQRIAMAPPQQSAALAPPVWTRSAGPGLRLPSAKVSALLVLVFIGFGAILGQAAGSGVQDTLAAARRPGLKVVLPATGVPSQPSSESASSSAESAGSTGEVEAPENEPTSTPTPSPSTVPAKAPASSTGSPGPGGGGEGSESSGSRAATPAKELPPIKHVFVIMLSDEPYAAAFGPESAAHYLSGTLEHRGTLMIRYDAVAHEQLADEIALISGQGPTSETAANCPNYSDLATTGVGAQDQVLGSGCVYPSATQTLPGELMAKHLRWRAYVQGSDEGTADTPCAHPVLGQTDPSANPLASSGPYATFRNPFVYFHSIIDTPACAADDVGLNSLKGDLGSVSNTPSFSYIVPDRCHDGNPTPCTAGAAAGLAPADEFLKQVVPAIMASKAYKQAGLIAITVDEAPSSGEFADSSSCCGQPSFPNLAASTTPGLSPRGGGTVGALLLSPYLKGAVTNPEPYNHFSLLRTIEDLFKVKHLGYAGLATVKPLEAAMFSSTKLR